MKWVPPKCAFPDCDAKGVWTLYPCEHKVCSRHREDESELCDKDGGLLSLRARPYTEEDPHESAFMKVGMRVKPLGKYSRGKITRVNADGSCTVTYDNGEEVEETQAHLMYLGVVPKPSRFGGITLPFSVPPPPDHNEGIGCVCEGERTCGPAAGCTDRTWKPVVHGRTRGKCKVCRKEVTHIDGMDRHLGSVECDANICPHLIGGKDGGERVDTRQTRQERAAHASYQVKRTENRKRDKREAEEAEERRKRELIASYHFDSDDDSSDGLVWFL